MKYHKIRNVAITDCVAEQKIAYNLSFASYHLYREEYNRLPYRFQKSELIHTAVKEMLNLYQAGYDYKKGKYNEDAIFCALNAGFENYLNAKYHIMNDYSEVGKMFPLEYINK